MSRSRDASCARAKTPHPWKEQREARAPAHESLSELAKLGARVRNIAANPKVTLNFDGDGRGDDVIVLSATAQVDPDAAKADANPAHLEEYAVLIERFGMTPAARAARFSVPVRIELTRLDGR